MHYLSDTEKNDLNDLSEIVNNLLGEKVGFYYGTGSLFNLELAFRHLRTDDSGWFLKQVIRLKTIQIKREQTNGNKSILVPSSKE